MMRLAALVAFTLTPSCCSVKETPPVRGLHGLSGMAPLAAQEMLGVSDEKNIEPGPRLWHIHFTSAGVTQTAIEIRDWVHPDGQASDLESIGGVPGHPGIFVTVESGRFKGRFGRVFLLEATRHAKDVRVRVRGVGALPDPVGNLEGCAAIRSGDHLLLLVAERGSSAKGRPAELRVAVMEITPFRLQWSTSRLRLPDAADLEGPGDTRSCSDLYVTPTRRLVVAATRDSGSIGPFSSRIYDLGQLDVEWRGEQPGLRLTGGKPVTVHRLDGLKVEALTVLETRNLVKGPTHHWCVASDDERLRGVVRLLGADVN